MDGEQGMDIGISYGEIFPCYDVAGFYLTTPQQALIPGLNSFMKRGKYLAGYRRDKKRRSRSHGCETFWIKVAGMRIELMTSGL